MSSLLLLEEKADDVVEVGVYHQAEEDNHAGVLCILHELVAGLATGNHLEEQEHDIVIRMLLMQLGENYTTR